MVQKGMTERTACQEVGLGRSSCRYDARPPVEPLEEPMIRGELRRIARRHLRYGYRRATALLKRQGLDVNAKRVWRMWGEEGLTLPRKRPRRRRLWVLNERPQKATKPNEVWSYDFIFDRTVYGEVLKMFVVVDEYTKMSLGIRVDEKITARGVSQALEEMMERYGTPEYVRSDNGPEFIADHLKGWLMKRGIRTLYIEPGHPWENGFVESFNGKFRDECLNAELFYSREEARVVVEGWRREYNQERPHSALGYQTPCEVAGIGREDATARTPEVFRVTDSETL